MPSREPIANFQTQRRVRTVDTDLFGTVDIGAYIRMMEETEYAFLRSRGLSVVLSDERGVLGFPRLDAQIEVKDAAVFDDELLVQLSLMEVDGKQVVYEFKINHATENGSGTVVATGRFRVVCCRFPAGKPPRAILTPLHVIDALNHNVTG